MSIKKIGILFSGKGSNLETLLKRVHNKKFNNTTIEVALTLTNNPKALGIEKSRSFGIEPIVIDHTLFKSREEFDARIVKEIEAKNIDLTVLAGFMRILTPVFTKNVKAINLHPSLLPQFKGANAIKRSYEANVSEAGVSVHFVSDELDGGEIIMQESFQKTTNMDYEEFEANIRKIEHEILPKAVIKLLT
jgi:phosphoribosylglycinamide formyltransferase-1